MLRPRIVGVQGTGLNPRPRENPIQALNPQPFSDGTILQPTETHQPRLNYIFIAGHADDKTIKKVKEMIITNPGQWLLSLGG